MKKITTLFIIAIASIGTITAQNKGVITSETLEKIRSDYKKDDSTKALQNAITNSEDLKKMALNREKVGKTDHYFKYRVEVKGITDQKNSGRCWMFTSLNTMRPAVIKKFNLKEFDFSHNYLYFWDLFEKSNLFLENVIATAQKQMDDREVTKYFSSPIDDGGVWNSFFNVADKYGVVPANIMPETKHSSSTRQITKLIRRKLRGEGYKIRELIAKKTSKKDIQKAKINALSQIYRMLSLSLGEPPTEFVWRFKDKENNIKSAKYTPKQFLEDIAPNYSDKDYVMTMNDPTREYYKVYEIKNYRNVVEGFNWTYLNLPNGEIKRFAIESIKNDEAMYASCDVGKQLNRDAGIMDVDIYDYASLFGVEFDMDKKARILTRESGSTHAMALIGVDVNENKTPIKWEFENSWGTKSGNKGYLTFTDEWFSEYIFRVVINKKYLSEKALKALEEKPIMLPVWDFMF